MGDGDLREHCPTAVWASYNMDRLLLQEKKKRDTNLVPEKQDQIPEASEIVVPEIRVEKCKGNLVVGNQLLLQESTATSDGLVAKDNSSGEFSNPFINFDVKKFLESTTMKEERLRDGLTKSIE